MTLTKAVVLLALLSVSISDAFEWPTLPVLDTAAITTSLGATDAKTFIDSYTNLKSAYDDIKTQYATVGPLLETAGTQGPIIITNFENLVATIQSVLNDPTMTADPLFIPLLAKEAFNDAVRLNWSLAQAKPLNIEGMNELASSVDSVTTTLSLLRCPVAVLDCSFGLAATVLGK